MMAIVHMVLMENDKKKNDKKEIKQNIKREYEEDNEKLEE
jgi:hypothetical protein